MQKQKDKKEIIKTIIMVFGVIILCLFLLISVLSVSVKDNFQDNKTNEIIETEKVEKITNYVRNRGEKERMQIYLAEFIKNIEKEEYSKAYSKLHSSFKESYFKTENDFIAYAKRNYSNLMSVEYEDIQRQGTYYILTITITNLGDNPISNY